MPTPASPETINAAPDPAGKENIPVRYLFCHASGVAGFDPPVRLSDVIDWAAAVSRLARQAPWWEPGTVSGYHAFTFGFLIGELIRRTTGLSLGTFLREEVTSKIGADFHLGLAEAEFHRLAQSQQGGVRAMDESSFLYRAMGVLMANEPDPGKVWENPAMRMAEMNGYGNARSLAKVGSVLANGGSLYGHELMSKETARLAYQEQIYTHDLYFDNPVRFGLGFGLASKEFPLAFPNAFHWGGYGGSFVVMEPDSKACWSYVPSMMDPSLGLDSRGARLSRATIAGVQALNG